MGVELHTVYKAPHDIGLCLCITTVDVKCVIIDRLRGARAFSMRTPLRDTWMSGHDGARGPLAPRDDAMRARTAGVLKGVLRVTCRGTAANEVSMRSSSSFMAQAPDDRDGRGRSNASVGNAPAAQRGCDDVPGMAGRWRTRRDRFV